MYNFLNDRDGLSSKDYLMLISTTVFFSFVVIGLVLVLFGKEIDDAYFSLLDSVAPVVMTVVGGTFGVQAVQEFRRRDSDYEAIRKHDQPDEGDESGRI